ncbi:MAG: (Fe-S)-binding protein [Candidatus Lindowbacteria bacterium]|nr:(Fe-S)-binding protein [Candidatus Lindowbacteria bacterium]
MNLSDKCREISRLSDEIMRCGRCGFCQNVCPVYQVTGHESGVARGRNMCAKELVVGSLELSRENEAFFTECLLCRACVDSCFSGVKTDEIVLAGRRALRRARGTSPVHKYIFETLLPDHRKLGKLIRLASSTHRLISAEIVSALRMFGWLGVPKAQHAARTLAQTGSFLNDIPQQFLRERFSASPGLFQENRGHDAASCPRFSQAHPSGVGDGAALFIGCGVNFMFPHVGEATATVLRALGYEVTIVDHGCCGLPAYTHGALYAATRMATMNIRAFSSLREHIVVTDCSSCASFLKEYPQLLSLGSEGDTQLLKEAGQFSARVRDITEVLGDRRGGCEAAYSQRKWGQTRHIGSVPIFSEGRFMRVTFHDPCHLSRHQKLSRLPRMTLRSLPGADFVDMKEADWCCGGAGAFAVEHPDLSLKILERKVENISASGADVVATTCPACLMQLRSGLSATRSKTRAMHLVEVVRECLRHA